MHIEDSSPTLKTGAHKSADPASKQQIERSVVDFGHANISRNEWAHKIPQQHRQQENRHYTIESPQAGGGPDEGARIRTVQQHNGEHHEGTRRCICRIATNSMPSAWTRILPSSTSMSSPSRSFTSLTTLSTLFPITKSPIPSMPDPTLSYLCTTLLNYPFWNIFAPSSNYPRSPSMPKPGNNSTRQARDRASWSLAATME